MNIYLILQHRIANILDQTSKCVCILEIFGKALRLSLVDQWLKFSENVLQLPNKPPLLNSALSLRGGCEITVQIFPSLIVPSRPLQSLHEVKQKGI